MLLKKNDIPQPNFVLVSHTDINKGDDKPLQEKLKKLYNKINDDTKFVCKILGGHGGKGVFICKYSNITSVLQAFFAIDEECQILVPPAPSPAEWSAFFWQSWFFRSLTDRSSGDCAVPKPRSQPHVSKLPVRSLPRSPHHS